MGTAGIKIKVMPTSPEVNLEELASRIKELVDDNGGRNREYTEEPIAFGLKAVIAFFEWPEEKDLSLIEDGIDNIENVVSSQVIDMRKID